MRYKVFSHVSRVNCLLNLSQCQDLSTSWRLVRQISTSTASAALSSEAHGTLGIRDDGKVTSIGIIGGGISGLSTAYYLLRKWKSFKELGLVEIVVYEASSDLGGWIQSKKIPVPGDGGYIRVDSGPRTLATSPLSRLTLEMIEHLDLKESVRWVKKGDPGSMNRFVYLGDEELYRFPTTLGQLLADLFASDSKLRPALLDALKAWASNAVSWSSRTDPVPYHISLGEQLSRHFGFYFTAHFFSAFVHGIYAGDIWKLSAITSGPWQVLLRSLPFATKHRAVSLLGIEHEAELNAPEHGRYMDLFTNNVWPQVRESFVFYLKEGMGLLPLALESYLRLESSHKVTLWSKAAINKVSMQGNHAILVQGIHGSQKIDSKHDFVVSCISPGSSKAIFDPSPPWKGEDAMSVGCVTLFWRDARPIKYNGFGYIISKACPMDKNPHGALGVIFDTSTKPDQDTAQGQKVTVLIGGPYWQAGIKQGMALPTTDELKQQALETLETQLGISLQPDISQAQVLPSCIPQPTIEFMQTVNGQIHEQTGTWARNWQKRLFLTGPPVTGPGVHDSIMGAHQTATEIIAQAWRNQYPVPAQDANSDEGKTTLPSLDGEKSAHYHDICTRTDVLRLLREPMEHRRTRLKHNALWPMRAPARYQRWQVDSMSEKPK